ncbi:unnamed protein product [Lactuca virosa]|uniref:J domain-containing protein n=1 Tax=Lactuca virosa TaxID=75947 RepID=A0AAU9PPN6_9ASTR|nr:unnamed protein product [Lactuca virosa]
MFYSGGRGGGFPARWGEDECGMDKKSNGRGWCGNIEVVVQLGLAATSSGSGGRRGSITANKVTEAHRRVMVANHPDIGGSHYLASKINEAKYKLIRKPNNTDSAFSYDLTVDSDSD